MYEITALRQGQLCQTPQELVKISTVYPARVTAQVVFPVLPRTTVREYFPDDVSTWREPTPQMMAKYEAAWPRTLGSIQPHTFVLPDETNAERQKCAECGLMDSNLVHRNG